MALVFGSEKAIASCSVESASQLKLVTELGALSQSCKHTVHVLVQSIAIADQKCPVLLKCDIVDFACAVGLHIVCESF